MRTTACIYPVICLCDWQCTICFFLFLSKSFGQYKYNRYIRTAVGAYSCLDANLERRRPFPIETQNEKAGGMDELHELPFHQWINSLF